jgi:hypothetical protein
MIKNSFVKIAEHCEKLTFLSNELDKGKNLDEKQFFDALDNACFNIWQKTFNDIVEEQIPKDERDWVDECDAFEACEYAEKRGYSIDAFRYGYVIPYYSDFVYMIKAEEHDAFAKTPEQRGELKLLNEVKQFVINKSAGVILGIN